MNKKFKKILISNLEWSNMNLCPGLCLQILALNDSPLTAARKLEERRIGICRGMALLICSILRTRGIPARLRVLDELSIFLIKHVDDIEGLNKYYANHSDLKLPNQFSV